MSEPFIAEVKIVGFNFAPRGWALCNGQILPINQNQALFSLVGTTYGGDGRTTFALPDFRGRAILGEGTGPGLSNRRLGERAGAENHTLSLSEIPQHSHDLQGSTQPADTPMPNGNSLGSYDSGYAASDANVVTFPAGKVNSAGGSQPHTNMQPYLAVNYCIALTGLFPSRN